MLGGGESHSAPPRRDAGLGNTFAAVIAEFIRLLAQHWALARAEMADSGAALGRAGVLALCALPGAFLGLAMLLAGAALALALVVPAWLAFVIVGTAALLIAGGLLLLARAQSRRCAAVPRRTIASLSRTLAELSDELR